MWNFLYRLASPPSFFQITQRLLTSLGVLAALFLIIGVIWGLFFSPPDYQQSDAFRIIYLHVPAAFMSMAIYGFMAFCALLNLIWEIKISGFMLRAAAPMGASMALLALTTGSIWGKPMWGTWWIWDARLTAEFILLLIYCAVLAVNAAFKQSPAQDKLASILILIGLVDLPVIHYSVYWWNTLHQGSTLIAFSKPKIALTMLYPLLCSLVGFALFCAWIILHKARIEILLKHKKQAWVKNIWEKMERDHDAII